MDARSGLLAFRLRPSAPPHLQHRVLGHDTREVHSADDGTPCIAAGARVWCGGWDSVYIIDAFTDSVVGAVAVPSEVVAFAARDMTQTAAVWNRVPGPGRVYAACHTDACIAVLSDSSAAVEERRTSDALRIAPGSYIIRSLSDLPASLLAPHSSLFSSTGRLLPVSRLPSTFYLPPGIYFLRQAASVTKVIVTRWNSQPVESCRAPWAARDMTQTAVV